MNLQTERTPRLRSVSRAPRFASLRSIMALILREIGTTNGRTAGGYAWALIEPLAGIALLTAVFSLGFRSPPLGTDFAIFYATGLLPFFMFQQTSGKVAQAINYSKQLLTYPRVTFIDAILARFALVVLTQLLVTGIVFTALVLGFETRTIVNLPEILLSLSMAASLGLGIGIVNCVLTLRFPVWQSIWSALTRPLILLSNVIFLIDNIPRPYYDWLLWNPLVHVTGVMRKAFYYNYHATYVNPAYVFGLALICCALGLVVLRRHFRNFLEL